MRFLSFLGLGKQHVEKKPSLFDKIKDIYFYEDDYCQIEILPVENLTFNENEIKNVIAFTEINFDGQGFINTYQSKPNPVPTLSKEFRADSFENFLTHSGFHKIKRVIHYPDNLITGNNIVDAFGDNEFAVFVEIAGPFIKNIWLNYKGITDALKKSTVVEILYDLGESYDVFLVDWNSLEVIDLKYKNSIRGFIS